MYPLSDLRRLLNGEINSLNEAYYGVPLSDKDEAPIQNALSMNRNNYEVSKDKIRILVRREDEATNAHGCSVKVQRLKGSKSDIAIPIPTKPYGTLKKGDPALAGLDELRDAVSSKEYKAISSFLYDNQMLIIAYWYSHKFNDDEVCNLLRRYIAERLINGKYYKDQVAAKSAEQLEGDKKEIDDYVSNSTKNRIKHLYYGA